MSDSWKAHEGGTFFLTFAVVGWIDLFTRRTYAEFLLQNLAHCQKNKGLLLYAYVIMPSHVHLIAGAKEGLVTNILRDFKTYTSKELVKMVEANREESRKEWLLQLFHRYGQRNPSNTNNQLWQQTNHPIELYSDHVFEQKLEYMMNNPVRDGLCTTPEAHTWSSANPEQVLNLEDWYAED